MTYSRQTDKELSIGTNKAISEIKSLGDIMISVLKEKPSREVSIAITNIEQAVMWAVKGLTA